MSWTRLNSTAKTQWIGLLIAILMVPTSYVTCLLDAHRFYAADQATRGWAITAGLAGMILGSGYTIACAQLRPDDEQKKHAKMLEIKGVVEGCISNIVAEAAHLTKADGPPKECNVLLECPEQVWEDLRANLETIQKIRKKRKSTVRSI